MPKIPATQKNHGANSELSFDYLHKILFPNKYNKCDGSKGQTKIGDTAAKDEFSELCKSLKNICLNEKPIMETSNSIRFSRPKGKKLFSPALTKCKKKIWKF